MNPNRACKKPDIKVAKNPPKLLHELITAVPTAAEAPVRNNVGMVQKGPIMEVEPTVISTSPAILRTGEDAIAAISAPRKQAAMEMTE